MAALPALFQRRLYMTVTKGLAYCLLPIACAMSFVLIHPAESAQRSDKEKAELFAKFDRNKDGSVDRDEFASEMINIFISVDKDSSGFIEAGELTDPDPKEFGDSDRDKDGKLSFDEVMREKLGDFKKADADKNKRLTLPEVTGYRQ